jgi:hypothetical protein
MKKNVTTAMALSLFLVTHNCKQIREGGEPAGERQPAIEIASLEQGG